MAQQKNIVIDFQHNAHPRDYIYELSTLYLVARCIHVSVEIKLFDNIGAEGVQLCEILSEENCKKYQREALELVINTLMTYEILIDGGNGGDSSVLKFNFFGEVPLEILKQLGFSKEEWKKSFDILNYLNQNPNVMEHFSRQRTVSIENNKLQLQSSSAKAIIFELAHLHLLSRAIHYATGTPLFKTLCSMEDPIKIQDFLNDWRKENNDIPEQGFLYLIQILSRYGLLDYNNKNNTLSKTKFSEYLTKEHPESLYFAMLQVDERWWNAEAYLRKGIKIKHSSSAYELANQKSFYQVVSSEKDYCFNQGMAAISLFEDEAVAEAAKASVAKFDTIVDVGGGKGGLLCAFGKYFGDTKSYILYEKFSESHVGDALEREINNNCRIKLEVNLGDFFAEDSLLSKIPKQDNAAYFIKCVLHNLSREKAIKILNNVHKAMGENCQLFLAERIIPSEYKNKPHVNKSSNLIMLTLFKEQAHNKRFYKDVLSEANFELNGTPICAGNYHVFVARPLTPKPEVKARIKETSRYETKQAPAPAI